MDPLDRKTGKQNEGTENKFRNFVSKFFSISKGAKIKAGEICDFWQRGQNLNVRDEIEGSGN